VFGPFAFTSIATDCACDTNLAQQLQPFWIKLTGQKADAGEIAAGPGEAGDKPFGDRIAAGGEDRWGSSLSPPSPRATPRYRRLRRSGRHLRRTNSAANAGSRS